MKIVFKDGNDIRFSQDFGQKSGLPSEDAVTKAYVDQQNASLAIDGVPVKPGDKILIKDLFDKPKKRRKKK